MIQTPVEGNGWRIEDAEFVVVKKGLKPLIGRDLFDALGTSVTQTLKPIKVNMNNIIYTQCPFKTRIGNPFPNLISRIGQSDVHIVKS